MIKDIHGRHNFGDALNGWMWPKLVPELGTSTLDALFLGIGSLLNSNWIGDDFKRLLVFGSGYAGGPVQAIDPRWHIFFVRGPQTAARMGLPPDAAITDPGLLVANLYDHRQVHRDIPLAVMTHEFSGRDNQWELRVDWRSTLARHRIHYIDPRAPVENVLKDIARCQLLVTEALHGAIVADAFRVPWIPVKFHSQVNEFKWCDWCESMELPYTPVRLPGLETKLPLLNIPVSRLMNLHRRLRSEVVAALVRLLTKNRQPFQSRDTVYQNRLGRLEDQLDRLRHYLRTESALR